MNRHYRNSFERKQYIDSIIEEYRTKKINRDSNSSSKKDLKTSDQSNSNLSKHHDEYQLRKTSNEDEKSKSNNMQEFESTVSTTHNKNQMSDEYQKPQGLGKATVSTKDGHFEQQMHKSLYSQKLQSQQQISQQQIQDRLSENCNNERQMLGNNNQMNYSNPATVNSNKVIYNVGPHFNNINVSDSVNCIQNSNIRSQNNNMHNMYSSNVHKTHNTYNNNVQNIYNTYNTQNMEMVRKNVGVDSYRNEKEGQKIIDKKEQVNQQNGMECTIKINGVDHQINLKDIPSQLFNQSVRNSVYMSNQFKPVNCRYVYENREWKIQDFRVLRQLGNGKYGEVYLCKDIMTEFMVAVKVISQKVIDKEDLEKQLAREIMIHSYLKHPNILEMYGWFRDQYNVYLILEYCQQGELFKLLSKQKNLRFSEEVASCYIKQLIEALLYLKQQQVIHRDVKPENILLSNENIKLCDFGWSVYDDQFQRRMTFCGTADYVSPEMINNEKYDCRVDTWSVGVLTYELLTGKPPFSSNFNTGYQSSLDNQMSYQMIFKNITQHKKEQIQFPEYISHNARRFIGSILEKNQEERAELRYLKRDRWILENCKEDQRIAQIKAKVKQFL